MDGEESPGEAVAGWVERYSSGRLRLIIKDVKGVGTRMLVVG